VFRGGDWTDCSSLLRAASRQATGASDVDPTSGLRCARSL
jgi:formylglycine-generating enzyme required for sulfatase activity